jgi:hypothetical protein
MVIEVAPAGGEAEGLITREQRPVGLDDDPVEAARAAAPQWLVASGGCRRGSEQATYSL